MTLTVAVAGGVCSASEPERAEPAADESSVGEPPAGELPAEELPAEEPPADESPADEPPADEPAVPSDTCTLADAPDGLADIPAWTAGVVACTADDDELSCAEALREADTVTGATDFTADADAAPTVLVTAPTVPVAAPTAPVTPCTASPTAVTVVPTMPSAVWLTWVTGPLVPTVTDTVVGVVVNEPGTGFCPVGGVGPEVIGRVDGVERVVDGDPAPLPLPPPGLRPWLPPNGRRRGGPAATG